MIAAGAALALNRGAMPRSSLYFATAAISLPAMMLLLSGNLIYSALSSLRLPNLAKLAGGLLLLSNYDRITIDGLGLPRLWNSSNENGDMTWERQVYNTHRTRTYSFKLELPGVLLCNTSYGRGGAEPILDMINIVGARGLFGHDCRGVNYVIPNDVIGL